MAEKKGSGCALTALAVIGAVLAGVALVSCCFCPMAGLMAPRVPDGPPIGQVGPVAQSPEKKPDEPAKVDVDLLGIRLEPFTTVTGIKTYMVCADLRNVGNRPVRTVYADITMKSKAGQVLHRITDYPIYAAASNDSPGIRPGETLKTKEGHILPRPLVDFDVHLKVRKIEERIPD